MAGSTGAALPLDLVLRFSTSIADIVVSIPDANRTTTLSLKQEIRKHLPPPARDSRLRLIHAGKVLVDTQSLVKALGPAAVAPPPPPRADDEDGTKDKSEKAKGKQPLRHSEDGAARAARVYIHCSIGDVLTPAELDAEAQQAQEADQALLLHSPSLSPTTPQPHPTSTEASTTTPAPRGFDRLLQTGFTHAEVANLRSQFLAIQAHTHTPDTMPTGPSLLVLEERWLDNGPGAGGFGTDDVGGLEDMLYGNLIGFFWPMGAMFWLMREEGVWSRRRQIAVLTGFLVNVTFGVLRVMV
ncbi:hypothetical protein EJ03DRAFT_192400 [Teratosphaeria nubilosa]|uniref:Ubiquitin-like domain-containing protein n=1 Tax=Teratosphaeria nubilosa TaxID=161662 RepID=A0A6G1KZF9_9PEZI|nr:hypothetical protein EJ03DRAFT_192400 [Teratosphaeria nubilosa]